MQAYVLSRATFRPIYQRAALTYDLCLDSLDGLKSQVVLVGDDISQRAAGGFLLVNGSLFLVDGVAPGEGATTLSLLPPEDLFDRPRIYRAPAAGATVGSFLRAEILTWRDEPDAVYALPYLDVSDSDTTPFVPPTVDSNGLYILRDYIRRVRRDLGVTLSFSARHGALAVEIRRQQPQRVGLVDRDGHTALISSAYSRTAVAKVTTVQPIDSGEVDENGDKIFLTELTDYYVSTSGAVSTEEPTNRASGDWTTLVISEKADPAEEVARLIAQNGETHKLEFYHDRRLQVRDVADIRFRGQLFTGTITAVSRQTGESRWLYQIGSLATKLTEKVRAAGGGSRSRGSSSAASFGSSSAGEIYAVGDVYITTRAGDPAALLGYGAWQQIQGRFLFAADGQHPAGSRGGSASIALEEDNLPELSVVDPAGLYTALQGAPSGSAQWNVSSRSSAIAAKTVGAGKEIPLEPLLFAIYVWIRKE